MNESDDDSQVKVENIGAHIESAEGLRLGEKGPGEGDAASGINFEDLIYNSQDVENEMWHTCSYSQGPSAPKVSIISDLTNIQLPHCHPGDPLERHFVSRLRI